MDVKIDTTPAKLVEEYIHLRNVKKKMAAAYADMCKKKYETRMDELEVELLDTLNKLGANSIKSETGTVHKIKSVSVTVADASIFRRHVIGLEAWDLIEWRASKTGINKIVEDGEALPPGINRSTFYTIGVRKPTDDQ